MYKIRAKLKELRAKLVTQGFRDSGIQKISERVAQGRWHLAYPALYATFALDAQVVQLETKVTESLSDSTCFSPCAPKLIDSSCPALELSSFNLVLSSKFSLTQSTCLCRRRQSCCSSRIARLARARCPLCSQAGRIRCRPRQG